MEHLPTPAQIKSMLDEQVVGQHMAKVVLSVGAHNHYKRFLRDKDTQAGKLDDGVEIEKSNILLFGPTGSGKTFLTRALSRILDVPFGSADATKIT